VTLTGVHDPGGAAGSDEIAGRLRDSGFMVALTDETRPAWDLAALAAEHRDDLIGRVVAGFGPEEDLSDRDRLALDYAITALMEGGRS
jgi:ribosomal protein S12 methylthiotransferase accessory factor YcaO